MAKRSTKKKSRAKKKKTNAGLTTRLEAIRSVQLADARRYLVPVAWVLGLGAAATAWIIGVPKLEAAAADEARPEHISVQFVDLPVWVDGDLHAMLAMTARRQLTGDVLQRAELVAAGEALMNMGWFERIHQVRRVRADLVQVEAEFVRPFAVIRDADGDHLVDPTGRLLPRSYTDEPGDGEDTARVRRIVITGAHFDRPQRSGVQWDGADVTAALRLLRLIDERAWKGQITAIDADRYLTDQMLVLVTDIGSRIVWGSAPGEEQALEVNAQRKLAYLDEAFRQFRRIDCGYVGELEFLQEGYLAE